MMPVCEQIFLLFSGLATPLDIKLKLIQVLKFIYHDTKVAKEVYHLLSCCLVYSVVNNFNFLERDDEK